MKISIELIPRQKEQLLSEGVEISERFRNISVVNIPDLLKLNLRSWEACGMLKEHFSEAIPHIRAMDFNTKDIGKLLDLLEQSNVSEILVLTGDKPQDLRKVYSTNSLDLIRKIKSIRDIKIYAAIDQYRGNIKKELEYIQRKLDAGADGFFTQPFFDIRFLQMYMDFLQDYEVYWGISPILSENAVNYWEIKNDVVFPKDFEFSLEWNIDYAQKVLRLVRQIDSNLYFMPVRTDINEYLSRVFEC
ncbi:MAG: methylenetetrahydrofolate reductase [Bacillota bacterium]